MGLCQSKPKKVHPVTSIHGSVPLKRGKAASRSKLKGKPRRTKSAIAKQPPLSTKATRNKHKDKRTTIKHKPLNIKHAPKGSYRRSVVRFDMSATVSYDNDIVLNGMNDIENLWYTESAVQQLKKRFVIQEASRILSDDPNRAKEWWRALGCLHRECSAAPDPEHQHSSVSRGQQRQSLTHQESRLMARAKLALAYQQEADLVGLERLLLAIKHGDEAAHHRPTILNFIQRYPNQPETIADFQQRITLPFTRFARDLAMAQEDAWRLEQSQELWYPQKQKSAGVSVAPSSVVSPAPPSPPQQKPTEPLPSSSSSSSTNQQINVNSFPSQQKPSKPLPSSSSSTNQQINVNSSWSEEQVQAHQTILEMSNLFQLR